MIRILGFFVCTLIFIGCNAPTTTPAAEEKTAKELVFETTGTIERFDPKIDDLIAPSSKIEILASGFTWTEGPLWVSTGKYLLFSDIPPNAINKWTEKDGISLYLKPSGYTGEKERKGEPGSNGLLLDQNNNLVLCQHGNRQMARMNAPLDNPKPDFITIVDNYQGKKLDSPNDAVYDKAGNLYFTDPPYGLEKQQNDPTKELSFQGVYRFSASGEMSLITDQLSRPNGIAFSPDEKTLYVANSDPDDKKWMAYDLDEKGKVTAERIFYDASAHKENGLPDGLKVDQKGNVWATGPGGVWIFSPEGKALGRIKTGELTSNCAFGENESVLYMTCDDYLMRVKL